MDGWQFGPAQQLRQAFILDDNQLGPIHWYFRGRRRAPMKPAVILRGAH